MKLQKLLAISFLLITCFVGLPNGVYSQEVENSIKRVKLKNTKIAKGYNYSIHYANNEYLLYVENYTHQVYLYSLNKKEVVFSRNIQEGRGPGEVNIITAGAVIGEKIYLADGPNYKILEIDINSGNFSEFSSNSDIYPRSFSVYNKHLVIENNFIGSLFLLFNIKSENSAFFSFGKMDPYKEFENTFFKEGTFCLLKNKLVFITQYRPYIYIFNLENLSFNKRIEFDISKVSDPRVFDTGSGSLMLPPKKTNIETLDIASAPSNSNNIFILARGESQSRTYDQKHLYEFNISKDKFINSYNLKTMVEEIVSNDNYIFVYSEKDASIYQYKF